MKLRISTAAILLASAIAVPLHAEPASSRHAAVVDTATIQIDNFGRVEPSYYRGGQPEGRDYADLKALGVRTVINLTSDDADSAEETNVTAAGMRYVQIPMTTHAPPTKPQLTQFLGIVNDPASQPVYVHCVGGRHRTGVMTAAYRMTQEGWTPDRAFQEMKQYKFGADFLHSEFREFVYAYRADAYRATTNAALK